MGVDDCIVVDDVIWIAEVVVVAYSVLSAGDDVALYFSVVGGAGKANRGVSAEREIAVFDGGVVRACA